MKYCPLMIFALNMISLVHAHPYLEHLITMYEHVVNSQAITQDTYDHILAVMGSWQGVSETLSESERTLAYDILIDLGKLLTGDTRAQRLDTLDITYASGPHLLDLTNGERDGYFRTLYTDNLIVTSSFVAPILNIYVLRAGDSMTGPLVMESGVGIVFNDDTNSKSTTIESPTTLTTTYTLFWPTGPGTSAQVLATDASGQLYWSSVFTPTAGIYSLNGLTAPVQTFTTAPNNTGLSIQSAGTIHTFSLGSANTFGVLQGTISNTQVVSYNNTVTTLGAATPNNVPNTLVLRDSLGSFSAQDISAQGNFQLPATTASVGQLRVDGSTVLQAFGTDNIFVGADAGNFIMTGSLNTVVGAQALANNTTGTGNVMLGYQAGMSNTGGSDNVAIGVDALMSNTTAGGCVAIGARALQNINDYGSFGVFELGLYNTAVGYEAMQTSTVGFYNVALGYQAMQNETGFLSTALGYQAMQNGGGYNNIALGSQAMQNGGGSDNIALGSHAMLNGGGDNNIAVGLGALNENTSGSNNIAIGQQALYVNKSGSNNIAIGLNAGNQYTGSESNNILIGDHGQTGDSGVCRIANISSSNLGSGPGVIVSSGNQLGVGSILLADQRQLIMQDSGSHTVSLGAPTSLSGTYTLLLPINAGSSGQVLSTDGSGNLSWITTNTGGGGSGIESLNGQTGSSQTFATSASGTSFTITSASNVHTFSLPPISSSVSGNSLVLRDGSGNINGQNINASGNLLLPSTSSTMGQLQINGNAVFHTYGLFNTFVGQSAGNLTLSSQQTTALGFGALSSLTTAGDNTAVGVNSLNMTTTGGSNTAIGNSALTNIVGGTHNTAIGVKTGVLNIYGSGNIYLGANVFGSSSDNNLCYIGNISATSIIGGAPVVAGANNLIGVQSSSRNIKENITDIQPESLALLDALRPVEFNYKTRDGGVSKLTSYGLIAEEVDLVAPQLVVYDDDGVTPKSIRFFDLTGLYIAKLQELQRRIDALEAQLLTNS